MESVESPMDMNEIVDLFAFGTADEVASCLEKREVSLTSNIYLGDTPLGVAVRFSNIEVVRCLLRHGADVNAFFKDSGGDPPVKVAYEKRDQAMFDLLCAARADLTLPGWMGISAADRINGV